MSLNIDITKSPLTMDIPAELPRYNNWAFQPILNQHFNRLRARLLNLAETSTRDRQQSDAMKGLIKDFINTAFYDSMHEIEAFCRDKGIISEGEGQCGPQDRLTAQSLKDILYEPETM
jgi:hypothetical protein